MAEEKEYTYTTEDIGRYRPIALAPEYVEEYKRTKDRSGLDKVIETVLTEGLEVRKDEVKDLSKTLKLDDFISVYAGKYQKALNGAKLRELRVLYDSLFKKYYYEDNLPKVNEDFNSNETYGDFIKRYEKVAETAKSETDNWSKEQKEQAQKDLEKLNKIADPLIEFEKRELNYLRDPIDDESLTKRLNARYEKKPKSETEEE